MKRSTLGIFAAIGLAGCGSSTKISPTASPDAGVATVATPAPIDTHPACVISVDCPSGQHCDLGECIQDCNTRDACTGELTCSPRARCIAADTLDADPAPVTKQQGVLTAEPSSVALTERDTTVQIKLTSTTTAEVRYRVAIDAPHLSIDKDRGSFSGGSGTITLNVNTRTLKGKDVPGTVKVFTPLGNVLVSAPIHVGITGSYMGSLRYDGGSVPLGDARIALDLIENNGDVRAQVVGDKSLLFPMVDPVKKVSVSGAGSYTTSSGLNVTINQRLESDFGGDRNHFGRPIGRRVILSLAPDAQGNLQGTFTEQVYGLFTQPVRLTGKAFFEFEPQAGDPSFTAHTDPVMPSIANQNWRGPSVFGWAGYCSDVASQSVADIEASFYAPLKAAMAQRFTTSTPISNVADDCRAALALTAIPTTPFTGCSLPPVLACAMVKLATATPTVETTLAVARLAGETLAAPLLVAKDDFVQALKESFSSGTGAEASRYDAAMTALSPAATWVMQPAALEYLRSLPSGALSSPNNDAYGSARVLADLFHTMATIDGERARLGAVNPTTDTTGPLVRAQGRALITYLESVTLLQILESWGAAPPAIATTLTGVLSPLNQGFAALTQGAKAFGIADGFVPFVFDPARVSAGPSNFEQFLASAADVLSNEDALEKSYTANARQYEQNQFELQQQLASVRLQFDQKLKDMCGASFAPDKIAKDGDWVACGANNEGQLGDLTNQVDEAQSRLNSSQSRIQGMKDKIGIDHDALAKTQAVHNQTINFIDNTGQQLEAVIIAEGVVTAAQKFIEIAANASVLNGGAPLGEGVVASVLELEKAGMEAQKQQLQTAQQMRMEESVTEIEYINGMANIQKETIDLAQLGVDIQSDIIALTGAKLRARNMLQEARSVFEERARQLAIVNQDPSTDPTFRILRDQEALEVLQARADAQKQLYLAGQALAYEINSPISTIGGAVLKANNSLHLSSLRTCYTSIFHAFQQSFGTPQEYVSTVSVRKMLGISAPRTDSVTGETLSEGQQFRQALLRNENLDGRGGVGLLFATELQSGNGLWSSDVCSDHIGAIQAQLVGDFLGDNQAQVNIGLSGGGVLRACGSDALSPWSFGGAGSLAAEGVAVIQAGVNTFGDAPANTSLYGQPVARASWKLIVPGPSDAPSNADVDISKIDDIVLKITHHAIPQRSAAVAIDLSCLGG